jgi:hypothetical protein
MYIYISSCDTALEENEIQIHITTNLTFSKKFMIECHPPIPEAGKYIIKYIDVWETTAKTDDDLIGFQNEVFSHFHREYLTFINKYGKTGHHNWLKSDDVKELLNRVKTFIESRSWIKNVISVSEIPDDIDPKDRYKYDLFCDRGMFS